MAPAFPLYASPTAILTPPPDPDIESPVTRDIAPEVASSKEAEPVFNIIEPVPVDEAPPEFCVFNIIVPLLARAPEPASRKMPPPV
jgi:hypothetical protein